MQFPSDYKKILLDLYDVYIHFIGICHLQSNGLMENRNRKIGKQLRNFSNDNKNLGYFTTSSFMGTKDKKNYCFWLF